MFPTAAHIEQTTGKIIGCAIEVHKTVGAGLLESVYRECMAIEMKSKGLRFEWERCSLHPIHSSQLITYLKLANCPAGLLLNFNVTRMKSGVKRLDHPDLYTPKKRDSLLPS